MNRRGLITGPGLLFVVSGPSGAGKDTLVEALRQRRPSLRYSISATTRGRRPEERERRTLLLRFEEDFEERLRGGGLLEWREYGGNLYGTPRDYVERSLSEGYDVIVKPEVNGALAVKAAYPDAVLIFSYRTGSRTCASGCSLGERRRTRRSRGGSRSRNWR